ncbi:MAG: transposase [Balneolaceae bacterium]|nr:transposase [Balneolaceae bacterium]
MKNYKPPFKSSHFYHVYNRGNNQQNIFYERKNYDFFLKQWDEYLGELVDVWAYCLLPNHFHFLINTRSKERLAKFQKLGKSNSKMISNQFRNFFISYTKSINKVYNRTGSLFQKPFKRIKVDSENYLLMLIHYIHHNPVHHNFVEEYSNWIFSSYPAILSSRLTKINREEVLSFFGGREKFLEYHQEMKSYTKIEHLTID